MALRVEEGGVVCGPDDPVAQVLRGLNVVNCLSVVSMENALWMAHKALSRITHDNRLAVVSDKPLLIEARILVQPGVERVLYVKEDHE